MAEYHKDETQKALKKYKFTALEHVFNAEFLEKVYEFKDNDPIQELYNTGLINYRKNLHLNTEMNKLHEKLVLLDYGLENIIKRYNLENWLEKCKKKYLQEKENTENKNAILGELYTAGFFARISLDSLKEITPDTKQKKETPDFECIIDNKKVIIEVNTPAMNNNEIKKIQNFKKNINVKAKERKKGRVYIDSCFVCPAGYNPKFKTTAENWISKFRNIKVNSRQLNPNQMNLLVINLYNKDMSFISKNHFEPLFISYLGESFYSGNIWQAFYGKTKDHILEEYCGCGEIPKMIFDGMFYTKASEAVSAAIIMMPSITVIYENPNAKTPLEYNVLMKLTKLYRFDLHLSQIRIPMSYYKNIDFKDEIEQQRRKINSISSFDCEFY